jgi:hypothetical protein
MPWIQIYCSVFGCVDDVYMLKTNICVKQLYHTRQRLPSLTGQVNVGSRIAIKNFWVRSNLSVPWRVGYMDLKIFQSFINWKCFIFWGNNNVEGLKSRAWNMFQLVHEVKSFKLILGIEIYIYSIVFDTQPSAQYNFL